MTEVREGYRLEHDSIGEKEVPIDAYYGVQTLRAHENFNITGLKMHPELIVSVAQIKKAAAITNFEVGELSKERASAIVKACDEIIDGKLHDQFIVDPIQGGAGTSLNMNANEVSANRAIEILGGTKGDYSIVNPNDHVNFGQSTNDVFPSCGKMAALTLLRRAQIQLKRLEKALLEKSDEFDAVIKMGRTQLQDAVPIRLGQEFHAYASAIGRDIRRFDNAKEEIRSLNMGGTAIGTGLNADTTYFHRVVKNMSTITGEELVQSYDTIDATQNLDSYAMVSGIVKSCAVNLSKMCNDLRLMSSGPRTGFCEINLPAKQNGSSIMPGKINPVIPEVVNQVAFNIIGNDVTITMAAEAGQLELNAFEPIIFYNRRALPRDGRELHRHHHRHLPLCRLRDCGEHREGSAPHQSVRPRADSAEEVALRGAVKDHPRSLYHDEARYPGQKSGGFTLRLSVPHKQRIQKALCSDAERFSLPKVITTGKSGR